jgi:hypothetical protein
MALWFICPHCGCGVADEFGENLIDYDNGLYRCEECGGTMSLDDCVDYEDCVKLWKEKGDL